MSGNNERAANHLDFYRGRKILVTGGLGFIGSNLCRALADLGAEVLAVDSLLPDYGGNLFNLAGYEHRVRINIADVRGHGMEYLVRGQELLFNLAGQVSHIDSMTDPFTDLEINCRSQLWILEAVRKNNPGLKLVYAGTRQVYGKPRYLPVDEAHLLNPTDVNGINKISGEFYHLVYHSVYGIRACSLRLTNTYGPRQLLRHSRQGFIGWFVRQALLGEEIQLYGDGRQKRDFDYVDDVVDAFLRAGAMDAADGEVFNLGGEAPVSLLELAELLHEVAGGGSHRLVPFPPERKRIDIGDFYADASKLKRALGWAPRVRLREGLERTLAFYREHKDRYL
jgi:UDP-glucose 4-epimerase